MKTHHSKRKPKGAKSKPNSRRRGVALVTVLTVMSLATILIMTFFTLAQNELKASSTYSEGLQAQHVAEEAVNVVIRQIRKATSNRHMPKGQTLAWASQPGAIRTWEMNGKFFKGFKLYSDDQMTVGNETNLARNDLATMGDWDAKPWAYVDLNEPVIRGTRVYYPIVDPTAKTLPEWPTDLDGDDGGIEGFDFSLGGLSAGPMAQAVTGLGRDLLPMPAMWIYQLKDGTLGSLNNGQAFAPLSGLGSTPTRENPIVARFAFWTDDETCKLNPNVHAGGASWATPMAGGDIDRNLGRFQPAQHEWQRYPGHPATTHLAPVIAPGITDITYQRDNMEMIFDLVPRVVGGGSLSGTVKVNHRDPAERNGLVADKDRLYPSLDEFIMRPDREPNRFPKPGSRGRTETTAEMRERIERMKFFLTVVSRAPEITVFNTPRISIWPTYHDGEEDFVESELGDPGQHTPFDTLIRFCGEIGSPDGESENRYEYHFQRANADSGTYDFYEIERNEELMAYLHKLTSLNIPGAGADGSAKSLNDKYDDQERAQILTQIFDYIRSTNLHDDTVYQQDWRDAFQDENTDEHLTYTNGRRVSNQDRLMHKGHGQVTPIRIDYSRLGDVMEPVPVDYNDFSDTTIRTKGMGRFYTLLEMGVHIICCADGGEAGNPHHKDFGPPVHGNYGTTEYGQGWIEDPAANDDYSNIPPLKSGVNPDDPNTWPQWLKDEYQNDPRVSMFLDPTRWNWQLAWLDQSYANAMPGSLYNQGALSADDLRLKPEEKLVQAALIFNLFTPSLGWVPINPDMMIDLQILDRSAQTDSSRTALSFTDNSGIQGGKATFGWSEGNGVDLYEDLDDATEPKAGAWASCRISRTGEGTYWNWAGGDRTYGGVKPATYFMRTSTRNKNNTNLRAQGGRSTPLDPQWSGPDEEDYHRYPFITRPFKVDHNQGVTMEPGVVKMRIYSAGDNDAVVTEQTASQAPAQLVQELEIPFGNASNTSDYDDFSEPVTFPAPSLAQGHSAHINEFGDLAHHKYRSGYYWSMAWNGVNPNRVSLSQYDADGRNRGRLGRVWGLGNFLRGGHNTGNADLQGRNRPAIGDVLYSVGVRHGDARLIAARPLVQVEDNLFTRHHRWQETMDEQTAWRRPGKCHNFSSTPGNRASGASTDPAYNLIPDITYGGGRRPYAMALDTAADAQRFGDFDNGMGNSIDGPYINKPDEGNTHSLFNRTSQSAEGVGMWDMRRDYGDFPYFVRDYLHEAGTPAYFSPNRIISSPGTFGSLPVGSTMPWESRTTDSTQIGQPWRTLLFRPNVDPKSKSDLYETHPGAEDPADHYFLDLFWMPVVEPYAISEPLSTAGKVNLNYQILPYTNIKRSTALRGIFKSEYMLCIPNQWARDYKVGLGRGRGYHWLRNPFGGTLQTRSLRSVILEQPTLEQFEERFEQDEIFRTASEICEIHLIPIEIIQRMNIGGAQGSIGTYTPSVEQMADGSYWEDHAVVGDNGRERPYSNIYTRITTKSNTYKVHYRAQVVKQASPPGRDFSRWDGTIDTMVAEYRGSSVVERYVEPNDPDIPDYATVIPQEDSDNGIEVPTIDEYYKFRVVNPTRFAP